MPLELQFDLVAHLLHRGGGRAVQGQGPQHVPALPAADQGVHLGGQGGAEHRRPSAPPQVALQVLPRQQQAAGQAHPVRLLCDVKGPPGPAGPGGGAYGPPALLRQGPQFRPGLAGRGPHVAEHLVQVQLPQGDWHGAHTRRMAETLSLICLATAGLFMV